jgi:transposase InsO family protein
LAAWPLQKWAIDIVGPFPEGARRVKFLVVATDYFTKWMEAKPLATITTQNIKMFMWEQVICRFRLPLYIVSDNGKQFVDAKIQEWCKELHIPQFFTFVAHPQGNGRIERVNRTILDGIKKRLDHEGASWVDEIPSALWAYRTMPMTSHGETPFSLTYGTEAVITAEIGVPSTRVLGDPSTNNDTELLMNLDLLEERREGAAINEQLTESMLLVTTVEGSPLKHSKKETISS